MSAIQKERDMLGEAIETVKCGKVHRNHSVKLKLEGMKNTSKGYRYIEIVKKCRNGVRINVSVGEEN